MTEEQGHLPQGALTGEGRCLVRMRYFAWERVESGPISVRGDLRGDSVPQS